MKTLDQLLADPDDALRNFTNRDKETGLVRQWLDAPVGSPAPMQMFYGVGGSGKTMLVARLRQVLRPEHVPLAVIDFDTAAGQNRFTNDIPATLFEVSRQLGVVCPRFELAYFRLLELMNQTANLRPGGSCGSLVGDLAESTVGEVTGKVLEAAALAPLGVGALVKLARVGLEYVNAPERQKAYREYRREEEGKKLLRWLIQADADRIALNLKDFLAMDLAQRLPERPGRGVRALVVFDTMEHLRRSGLAGRQQFTDREQWIFELWKACQAPAPDGQLRPFVQFVLLGRDRLTHWEDYCTEILTLGALQQTLLGGFAEQDARDFLAKHQIHDRVLQDAILQSALDVESQALVKGYHAMSLGLLADTVTVERQAGREPDARTLALSPGKLDELAGRFLQSLPTPTDERRIVRLARTPRFDERALEHLCGPDRDANVEERRRILGFTFVQDAGAPGWYTLHPRMRQAILSLPKYAQPVDVDEHHAYWAHHWRHRSQAAEDEYAGLAWYHDYQLDREKALENWRRLAERARGELRMRDHARLLEWWSSIGIERDRQCDTFEGRVLAHFADELRLAGSGLPSINLTRAVVCLKRALQVLTRQESPQDWAGAQSTLGVALSVQGTHAKGEEGTRLLDEAEAAYQTALEIITRKEFPQRWAMLQSNLGITLRLIGIRRSGEEGRRRLGEAVAAQRATLEVFTRELFPLDWARTQMNLGDVLREQAIRTSGDVGIEFLHEAVERCRAAVGLLTKDASPKDCAIALVNLVAALRDLGIRTAGKEGVGLLREAASACGALLQVFTRQEAPQDWASTQHNLGTVLRDQGLRACGNEGRRLLGEAVMAYQVALKVRTYEELPQHWARTQSNLGDVLRDLGVRTGGEEGVRLLQEAVLACRAALEVFTYRDLPQDWAITQHNLGAALSEQGIRARGEEGGRLLSEAEAAYRAALRVRTRGELPQDWAMTQNNLGGALLHQGVRTTGSEGVRLFTDAVAAFRAALEICTRETLPQLWATAQNNLAEALRQQGIRWGGEAGAQLLEEAATLRREVEKAAVSGQTGVGDSGTPP